MKKLLFLSFILLVSLNCLAAVNLAISGGVVPNSMFVSQTYSVSFTVQNSGTTSTSTSFYIAVWISPSSTFSTSNATNLNADILVSGGVAANSSKTVNGTITIPASYATGIKYIIAGADGTSVISESSESDNNTPFGVLVKACSLNTPVNLLPGGTSSSPATVSTTTPTLQWNAVTDATCYGVYIRNVATNVLVYNSDAATATNSFTVPSGVLSTGMQYRWNCLAKTNCSSTSCISSVAGVVYFNVNVPCNLPIAPTGLTATAISQNQIDLNWNSVSGATNYEVDYGIGSCPWGSGGDNLTTTNCNTCTTSSATGLSPNTTYRFIVIAKNSCGWGTTYNCVSATTSSSSCTSPAASAPTDKTVVSPASATFTVNATAGTSPYIYQWQALPPLGSWGDLNNSGNNTWTTSGSNSTLTISNTTGLDNYHYRCKISNGCNPAATSNAALLSVNTSTTCSRPIATVDNPNGTGSVTISCTASGGSGGSYAYKWYSGTSCSGSVLGTNSTLPVTTSGSYSCKAYISGNESSCFTCATGNATVNSTTNNITGTLYDYAGTNATPSLFSGASVGLLSSSGSQISSTTTNSSGAFQFSNLTGSNYKVYASHGAGSYLVNGTTQGVNPETNLSPVKLPYSLHQQTSDANLSLSSHQFDYSIGYIFTLPTTKSAFNTSFGLNLIQTNLAIFNNNIDKKIEALQRMLALYRTMKVIDNNGAQMIQRTNEEIINGVMLCLSTETFVKHFNMLLSKGGLNPFRYLFFQFQRGFLEMKINIIKGTINSILNFITNSDLKSKIQKVIDGSFAYIQDYIDSDNQKDFDDAVWQHIMNDLIDIFVTPYIYRQYFIDPIQNNLNQSSSNLATLNFGNSTADAIGRLDLIQSNSGNSYSNSYSDLVFWSSFADGLSSGRKIFTLGKAFILNPLALTATEVSSVFLGIGAYTSEAKAIYSGLTGVNTQRDYAISASNTSTQRTILQNGFSMFIDSASNDSIHILYQKEDTAISNMQNEGYSFKSVLDYYRIDSNINIYLKKLITTLNNQFIAEGNSSAMDSFYNYMSVSNSNLNFRSNFSWVIASKIGGFEDPKIDDSLSFYSSLVKENNIITDSVLKVASLVSSNMLSPSYFTLDKVLYPTISDTGIIIPVSVIVRLHSDTMIAAHINLNGLLDTIGTVSKTFLPNKNDTTVFLINTGNRDTSLTFRINAESSNTIGASQNISIHVQSEHRSILLVGSPSLCSQDSTMLIANAPNGYIVNWKEKNLGTFIASGDTLVIHSGFPGIFTAQYKDTITSNWFFSQNSIEITNPIPLLADDKNVIIVCPSETTDISNLYNTSNLTTLWDIPNPTTAGLGVHKLIVTNSSGCKDTAIITVKQDIETWLGGISNDWHNPINWSGNHIPNDSTHVIIGQAVYPCLVTNNDANAASIQLKQGGTFNVNTTRKSLIKSNCSLLPIVGNLSAVTTLPISGISTINANSGGSVDSDGGTPVTARGICWSTTPNPTIVNRKTTNGDGVGSFASILTGLSASTMYYVRAYATNSAGTNYGSSISFITPPAPINDIDGNAYSVINICNKNWLSKNLEVTKYRNGDTIPQVQDPAAWANLTTGAWCYYQNNIANGIVYGKLYNWYAVTDPRGLAPAGWHIASNPEWITLVDMCLGGSSIAGGKMKTTGIIQASTGLWNGATNTSTNSSGFSGVPGGTRLVNGTFSNMGNAALWWTSTQSTSNNAWFREADMEIDDLSSGANNKKLGMAVRCIKD